MPDTGMEGDVERRIVLRVLSAVSTECKFSYKEDEDEKAVTLVFDGTPEYYPLPERVRRKLLQRLANKYGVKIEYFYHPEMCCGPSAREE